MKPLLDRIAGFEHSPIPTWVAGVRPLRVIWGNARAVELWGASSLEELCQRDFSGASEATLLQIEEWLASFRNGSLHFVSRDWTLYPNGVPLQVRSYLSPFELDDGTLGYLQQAWPNSNPVDPLILRCADALRHTPLAVATLSATGDVWSRNPAMERAFGPTTSPDTWFEDAGLLEQILDVARTGEVLNATASTVRGGEARAFSLEARKTQDPVTGDDAILIHLLDETARLVAERDAARKGRLVDELRGALATVNEQEQRWRALVGNAPDHIFIVGGNHRIEFVNHGLDPQRDADALRGTHVAELFDEDTRGAVSAAIERAFTQGVVISCNASLSSTAAAKHFRVRIGPIRGGERIDRLVLIVRDVTEHRGLEQQLRHAQRMQAVGTLAGGVAHDFNNLLMIISGACELAMLRPDLNNELMALLTRIGSAAERAGLLTQKLLSVSRKQVVQPTYLNVNRVIEESLPLLTQLMTHDVVLDVKLSDKTAWVYADRGHIEQIVLNLTINARDAMPEGGIVTLSTKHVGEPVRALLISVSDTGLGIDPSIRSRIFDPFFTTKERGKGTGLGLAMVHSAVQQSQGRIELHSVLGEGTRFDIQLPVAHKGDGVAATPVGASVACGGSERVLVVDDDVGVLSIVADQLALLGYRVETANTLIEAVSWARRQESLDLLLTDVVLLDCSGPEVRDAVLALHPDANVLFMSGYNEDAVIRHGVLSGRKNLLQKPFTMPELAAKIRHLLDAGPSAF